MVIDSMPPATTTSASPLRIIWSARYIALMPERQTLFSVIAGTVIGMPRVRRGLARRDLPGARLQHLTHQHVVDLLGADAGALERALDGDAAEVDRAQSRRTRRRACRWGCGPMPTMTEPVMVPPRFFGRKVSPGSLWPERANYC